MIPLFLLTLVNSCYGKNMVLCVASCKRNTKEECNTIFLTGDTHGDFQQLGNKHLPQCKEMTRDDYVIICGDFGGLWAGNAHDRYWLDWLNEKPFTTLFVDGNHENFDLLNAQPEKHWNGGESLRAGECPASYAGADIYL